MGFFADSQNKDISSMVPQRDFQTCRKCGGQMKLTYYDGIKIHILKKRIWYYCTNKNCNYEFEVSSLERQNMMEIEQWSQKQNGSEMEDWKKTLVSK